MYLMCGGPNFCQVTDSLPVYVVTGKVVGLVGGSPLVLNCHDFLPSLSLSLILGGVTYCTCVGTTAKD